MKIGDVVLVRLGNKPIALVEVTKDATYTTDINENLDWFVNRREIRVLQYIKNPPTIKFQPKTLTKSLQGDIYKYIDNLYKSINHNYTLNKDFLLQDSHLGGHVRSIKTLLNTDDFIISASSDSSIRIWCKKENKEIATLKGHNNRISSLVQIDKDTIASGSWDKTIKIWDIEKQECTATLKGHNDWISSLVQINKDTIASGSDDGTIKIWDIKSGKELNSLPRENSHMSFDNNILYISDNIGNITAIDIQDIYKPIDLELKYETKTTINNLIVENDILIFSTILGDLYVEPLDKNSFEKINESFENRFHIKTLLLGNSGVGKTTLGYWLNYKKHNDKIHSTHGMRFFEYKIYDLVNIKVKRNDKIVKEPHRFVLDIWDFGGTTRISIIS